MSAQSGLPDGQPDKSIVRPPSVDFFTEVKSWITECGLTHELCNHLHEQQEALQARILKITHQQGDFKIQLQELNRENIRYIALSHCWGGYQPLKTTTDNLSNHLQDIKWSSLPKTFQDAVIITHGLGIEYLWIDSLCIVQDDDIDWEKESAEMKHVYGFSYLTIAAAAGEDSRHGLFQTGEISWDDTINPVSCDLHAVMDPCSTSPLFTRAWVLQERLIASRTLYFCDNEIVFECSSHIRCQCSGVNLPNTWVRPDAHMDKATSFRSLRYRFTATNRRKVQHRLRRLMQLKTRWSEQDLWPTLSVHESCESLAIWDEVLYHYCRRHITYLRDRLPALSGMAGAFGSTGAHGTYCGGLWEAFLVQMMLWYMDPKDDLATLSPSEDDKPRAPS